MRISDWSSDVCSSDLLEAVGEALGGRFLGLRFAHHLDDLGERGVGGKARHRDLNRAWTVDCAREDAVLRGHLVRLGCGMRAVRHWLFVNRSAEPACRERVCQYV